MVLVLQNIEFRAHNLNSWGFKAFPAHSSRCTSHTCLFTCSDIHLKLDVFNMQMPAFELFL